MDKAIATVINENNILYQEFEAELELVEPQTLFVKTNTYNEFPEIYDDKGVPYLVTYLTATSLSGDAYQDFISNKQTALALTKLEQGYMVDNTGKIYTNITVKGQQRKIYKEFISTNDGKVLEVLKGRNFGGKATSGIFTTKGIDQTAYLSKYGIKGTILKILKPIGTVFSLFDIASFMNDVSSGNASFASIPPLEPISILLNAIGVVAIQYEQTNEILEEFRRDQLNKAKEGGLETLEEFLKKDKNWNLKFGKPAPLKKGEISYKLLKITSETSNKILEGEFKSIDRLIDFNYESRRNNDEIITILYQTIGGGDYDEDISIIETFYIKDTHE